jgi:hypothetical protein
MRSELSAQKGGCMDDIIHDLLLFISVAAPPIIFGFLLYLGLHITERDEAEPVPRRGEQKHPRRLQP